MRAIGKSQSFQMKKTMYNFLKIIVVTYILTGIMLLILSFMKYKMDLADSKINLGIIVIMVLSTFAGGILAAKSFREKRFIYGGIVGIVYFVLLVLISLISHEDSKLANDAISMLVICLGGGVLGGMLG